MDKIWLVFKQDQIEISLILYVKMFIIHQQGDQCNKKVKQSTNLYGETLVCRNFKFQAMQQRDIFWFGTFTLALQQ
jgi:hypothetical protein